MVLVSIATGRTDPWRASGGACLGTSRCCSHCPPATNHMIINQSIIHLSTNRLGAEELVQNKIVLEVISIYNTSA